MVNVTGSCSPKHFLLKALSNYWTFALLTVGFCTFDRSWNLSTNISQSSIPCSAYLQGSIISNKGGVRLIQISQKDKLFHLYNNQVLLGVKSEFIPPFYYFQKGLLSTFSLSRNRIYLDTHLKEELTDLIWKLPG